MPPPQQKAVAGPGWRHSPRAVSARSLGIGEHACAPRCGLVVETRRPRSHADRRGRRAPRSRRAGSRVEAVGMSSRDRRRPAASSSSTALRPSTWSASSPRRSGARTGARGNVRPHRLGPLSSVGTASGRAPAGVPLLLGRRACADLRWLTRIRRPRRAFEQHDAMHRSLGSPIDRALGTGASPRRARCGPSSRHGHVGAMRALRRRWCSRR